MPAEGRSFRQWRVGSFSMGLVLVLLGVALLVAQDGPGRVLELVHRWWPVTPILLGGEILLAGYFVRDEKPRLKYDWLAIIAVIAVVMFTLGLAGLAASGVLPALERSFSAAEYTVALPELSIPPGEGVTGIVVQGAGDRVEIRSSTGPEVLLFGQAHIRAVSEQEARSLASLAAASTRRAGDTLFLTLSDVPVPRDFSPGHPEQQWTLLVPAGMRLEFKSGPTAGTVNLVLDHLAADWTVQNAGQVKATLSSDLPLRVRARVPRREFLTGDLPWRVEPGHDALPSPASGERAFPSSGVTAAATLGEGGFLLHIDGGSTVDIRVSGRP
ncbi:MAG: hypothetical protein D9V47_01810 [Clostridia bacterium]|nr:MAG: hypothetical protein D9V47_01810 [Clostridia bacterium]